MGTGAGVLMKLFLVLLISFVIGVGIVGAWLGPMFLDWFQAIDDL